MNAAYVEPVVHNSPDRWDALAFMCVGVAIYLIMRGLIWLANQANGYWAAKTERDAHAAVKTRTWYTQWAGKHEDVAEVEAAIKRGDYVTKLTTAEPHVTGRLAAVKRGQR